MNRPLVINDIHEIIGFDLGHGESALTLAMVDAKTEPQVLDVQSRKSFISAVAVHPKRGVIIGEEAYTARSLDTLKIRFKSADLENPAVREPIRLFVTKILDLLQQNGLIRGQGHSHFVVGCPSGWSPLVRERYAALLREAGMTPLTIMAESRAAFIHAKESAELHVSGDTLLAGAVLIVDIGSSTTDFTAVQHLTEHYMDFGDIALGAGLLDRLIFDYTLAAHERRAELVQIFNSHPQYEAMCELKCRKAKETYFSIADESHWIDEPVLETLKLPTADPIYFDVRLTRADMQTLLATPVSGGLSWPAAFERELRAAREQMRNTGLPQLLFLTGGASRMGFVYKQCQAVFPKTLVVRGKEPELSIAKGLAGAGRIDRKSAAFRQEIRQFFQSGKLHELVETGMHPLLHRLAQALMEALPTEILLPAFRDWQKGYLKTLRDMEIAIEGRTESWLKGPQAHPYLASAVEHWFTHSLTPELEIYLNPLCDKYGIPRTAFSLQANSYWHAKMSGQLVSKASQRWGVTGIATLTGVVVGLISATLAGGSGVALLTTGPVGWIVGLIGGLAVGYLGGQQAAKHWVQDADLYLWMRRLFITETRLQEKIEKNQPFLQAEIFHSLQQDGNTLEKLANEIRDSIQARLHRSVEEVALLIH